MQQAQQVLIAAGLFAAWGGIVYARWVKPVTVYVPLRFAKKH